jgi:hypothetical protein
MENQEQQALDQEQSTQPVPTVAPELTVTDLQNIRTIIDAASRRGAFGAGEMSGIGAVFNKLDAFLNAVAPQQPPADQPPAA